MLSCFWNAETYLANWSWKTFRNFSNCNEDYIKREELVGMIRSNVYTGDLQSAWSLRNSHFHFAKSFAYVKHPRSVNIKCNKFNHMLATNLCFTLIAKQLEIRRWGHLAVKFVFLDTEREGGGGSVNDKHWKERLNVDQSINKHWKEFKSLLLCTKKSEGLRKVWWEVLGNANILCPILQMLANSPAWGLFSVRYSTFSAYLILFGEIGSSRLIWLRNSWSSVFPVCATSTFEPEP